MTDIINKPDMSVNIAGLKMKNPVIMASGTFGFGGQFLPYMDLNRLGGISVKGLTLKPRQGNASPRIAETPGGILNSVGLQNPGVESFINDEVSWLKEYDTAIIANAAGNTIEEYCQMAEILNEVPEVSALEVNVSCPNVKEGGVSFGVSCELIEQLTKEMRRRYSKTLIVKLTPNVTSIADTAKAAEAGGADCVSLINTLLGMAIDIHTRRPILANNTGGLSGPCVKPIAVRMVSDVYRAVKIPIIGMGGISTGEDAIEFFLAGASAIMVGTANLVDPAVSVKIEEGIERYLIEKEHSSLKEIVGKLEFN